MAAAGWMGRNYFATAADLIYAMYISVTYAVHLILQGFQHPGVK